MVRICSSACSGQLKHLVNVFQLFFRELLGASIVPPGSMGDMMATVSDAFYFSYFA